MNRRSFFQIVSAAAAAVAGSKVAPADVIPRAPIPTATEVLLGGPRFAKTYRHASYGVGVRVSPELLESDTHARLWRSIAEMGARLREEQDAAIFDAF